MAEACPRLVMIGGGPRTVGILERLVANAADPDLPRPRGLEIHVIDPHPPGAGRIWRYDQHELLLMNSRAEDVTIFTDDSVLTAGPTRNGPTLAQWAEEVRNGTVKLPDADQRVRDEIAALTADSFASRRVQSQYLSWVLDRVVSQLPDNITIEFHRDEVVSLAELPGGGYSAGLAGGGSLAADLAVIAVGHTDSRPAARDLAAADFAERHGLYYSRPAQTQDVDYSPLGWDRNVLVSGMGLAFIDLMAILYEGRGGTFHPDPRPGDPDRLRYEPAGTEPRLWAGSRRGIPYHSKISAPLRGEFDPALRFITPGFLAELPDPFSFTGDVLPAVEAELEYFVYREILTGHPEWAGMTWEEFEPAFRSAVEDGTPRERLIAAAIPDARQRVDLRRLDRPFRGREFSSREHVQQALRDYITEDLRLRTSPSHSETLALFTAIFLVHEAMSNHLPLDRLDEHSRRAYPGAWMSFFSLMDSGPPPRRLQQLLAIHRQGLIMFLGPSQQITLDEERGKFVATSGQSPDELVADAYIDAFLPPQVVEDSANPLLADLAAPGGLGREQRLRATDGDFSTGKLEIDDRHRLVAQDGVPHEDIWATGPSTSEVPVGAFARPDTNAAAFRRNDDVARQLWQRGANAAPHA